MTSESTEQTQSEYQVALRHRERQIQAIQRITAALFSHRHLDDMVRETLTVAIEVLDADVGSLQLYDAANDTLVFRYVIDPRSPHLVGYAYPTSQGIGGHVFKTGVAQITNKVSDQPRFNMAVDTITGYHTESMVTVPLKHFGGECIGVVQLLNARQLFDERDLEVLAALSAQAAAAMETARLSQQARQVEIVNLIGDISHDIKNMLTPIQSGVQTLQPMLDGLFEDLDCIQSECPEMETWGQRIAATLALVRDDYAWILESALESVDRVQTRTKQIADAIKGEVSAPFFEPSDVNSLAQDVLRSLRPVAEKARVSLQPDLDSHLPEAHLDRQQIYNALYNLVNNAIPETPADGSIYLRTRAPQPNTTMLLIEVTDTGRGMPEHIRARLFTDQAVSTKIGGTGLGTRIVADAVRRHGGHISVTSQEGQGTTFSIRLPLAQLPSANSH